MSKVINLDQKYNVILENINKYYEEIKKHFISMLTESKLRLNTYKNIYINVKKRYFFSFYPDDKNYTNNVNALINLIVRKEINLEVIRLEIFMENCKFKDDLYLEVKKQYSRQNLNNILVNNIKPKLLSILEEAKDSFGTLSS